MSGSPELLYGMTLGMLAAVNPCGFPLLPAYLELFTGGPGTGSALRRVGRAVTAGACCTVGFLVLFGTFGIVVELGWDGVASHALSVARWAMVVLGVAMVVAGVASLTERRLRLPLPRPGSGIGLRRPVALVVFGLSYGLASLGCALPLFLSGVATAFTGADPTRGAGLFVAYALGMGSVLCALALVVALLGPAAARPLRRASRVVAPLGSVLLIAVGAYLTVYWVTELADPAASNPVERLVTRVQQDVAGAISANAEVAGALLAGTVIAGILVVAVAGLRTGRGVAPPAPPAPAGAPRVLPAGRPEPAVTGATSP